MESERIVDGLGAFRAPLQQPNQVHFSDIGRLGRGSAVAQGRAYYEI
jgi:hypothetical protein